MKTKTEKKLKRVKKIKTEQVRIAVESVRGGARRLSSSSSSSSSMNIRKQAMEDRI